MADDFVTYRELQSELSGWGEKISKTIEMGLEDLGKRVDSLDKKIEGFCRESMVADSIIRETHGDMKVEIAEIKKGISNGEKFNEWRYKKMGLLIPFIISGLGFVLSIIGALIIYKVTVK